MSRALLKLRKNGKICYNHFQLTRTHKAPVSLWTQKIQKAQFENENSEKYKNCKATYILKNIVKKFVKKFYKNPMQRYNGEIALV